MKAPGGFLGKILGPLNRATSEEREKMEHELPFVVMVFTLLAASGVSPYDSWKKMRKLSFLPNFNVISLSILASILNCHGFLEPFSEPCKTLLFPPKIETTWLDLEKGVPEPPEKVKLRSSFFRRLKRRSLPNVFASLVETLSVLDNFF